MDDELHEESCSIEDLPLRQMAEAFLQPVLERDHLKELLNHDQSRKGCQPVIFEPQFWQGGRFRSHAVSATLHGCTSLVSRCFVVAKQTIPKRSFRLHGQFFSVSQNLERKPQQGRVATVHVS
jgi:hypothetical protein